MNWNELLAQENLHAENDSRRVTPGCVFCAIRGAGADGRRFIPSAIQSGAVCIVADSDVESTVPVVRVPDAYRAWGLLCEAEAKNPASKLKLHAVTGTNGKTTIAFLMRHFFGAEKCGLISTVEIDNGGGAVPSEHTTPDARSFQSILSECVRNGLPNVMMELSSHGLHQHRIGSAKFATAIFTNLTGDHLDYHHDMESYYRAKRILFEELSCGTKIINTDDSWGERLQRECGGFSFSAQNPEADIRISDIRSTAEGTLFKIRLDGQVFELHSPLIGLHNAYNLGEAFAGAYYAGISPDALMQKMALPFAVPGRLERIALNTGANAFVDYAHTDDALCRVLSALRPLVSGKLLCVFGCGGDRDRTKRPRMGRAVSELADYAVVTSDNPRSEKPEAILDEIRAGIVPGFSCDFEPDRKAAIELAVRKSAPGDILLVAGKGHETTQEICGVKHPFDDREILRKFAV